ncbi:hypothetical protein [Ostreiculturibacter nitratireducens]|uniref:hypothetical protein n=1 Tax=Ostreiculturibacter nitratireducens TaxID=3075226 RepID=UPI0031B5F11A
MKKNPASPSRFRNFAAAFTLALLAVACAPVAEEVGECEPGVADISRVADVAPPC